MAIMSLFKKYFKSKLNAILIVSFIIALVIGILFKYNCVFTTDNFINYVTGISTLFTSLIILLTLFEMKQQRVSTYKPVIVVKDVILKVKWESEDLLQFTINGIKPSDLDNVNKQISKGFELYNIGSGAAQKIKILFDFNSKEIIEAIKKFHVKSQIEIDTFTISSESTAFFYQQDIENEKNIDYILPANIDSKPVFINLPHRFTVLFLIYEYFFFNSSKELIDSIGQNNDFKKGKLTIHYQDIGNEQYCKKFDVEFSMIMFHKNHNPPFSETHIKIEVRECYE